jgi:cell division protein FtsB
VAKTVLVCVVVAGTGLGYVWQKNQIYRLGDEIKRREAALTGLEKRNTVLAAQLAQLQSPGQLETRCQQYNLGLTAPRESQMIRLYEPGPAWDTQPIRMATTPPAPRMVARR